MSLRELLRARPDADDPLARHRTDSHPGVKERKKAADQAVTDGERLASLQERLWAEKARSVLLVLQGIDTSGKDGTIKHVIGQVNPLGCRITSFHRPTPEEAAHHFLWRIRRALPEAGPDRRVRPLPLRGRHRPPGARRALRRRDRQALRRDRPVRGRAGGGIHHHREVLPAHLLRGAARAAHRPARRPRQALEVRGGRHRRAGSVAQYQDAFREMLGRSNPGGPVVRRSRQPQVVPQLGGRPTPARDPHRDGPRTPRPAARHPGPQGPADGRPA